MSQDHAIKQWYLKHNKQIKLPRNPYDEVFTALSNNNFIHRSQLGAHLSDEVSQKKISRPQFYQLVDSNYGLKCFAENYQFCLRRERVMEKVKEVHQKSYNEKCKALSQLFNIQDVKIRQINGHTLNRKVASRSFQRCYPNPAEEVNIILPTSHRENGRILKFCKIVNHEVKEENIWPLRNYVEQNKQLRCKSMFQIEQLGLSRRY